MTSRPALIFDFGNVVAHFDYARAGDRLGRSLGLSGQEFLCRAREGGFVALLRDYESGGLTSAVFHERLGGLTGLAVPFEEFAPAWSDIFSANESVHRLIEDLHRRGYRLILGSNTNELQAVHFLQQFAEVFRSFDALVFSFEVGRVKPDPGFYLACAEAAGRSPGDCVFIDDMPENVEGARSTGLVGLLYTDTPRLVADLFAIGIDPGAGGDPSD